ncbi:MAG: hypothetical protein R2882_01455 [Gemmatimonadales bacterium]
MTKTAGTTSATPSSPWPGDEYELAIKILRPGSAEYGVRGEYVDGKYAKTTDDPEASGSRPARSPRPPLTKRRSRPINSQLAPGRVFQPKFTEQELIDLTRNGHRDPARSRRSRHSST